MKLAYFDCYSGISGDMTIAAFIDAGLSMRTLTAELKKLRLKNYRLRSRSVRRGSLTGTQFEVLTDTTRAHTHRTLADITRVINASTLDGEIKKTALAIFATIAAAEARVHGTHHARDVRLHELGEIDSIIDIVGTAIAIHELGIDEVHASALTMGRTTVRTAHGTIPIPGPATLEIAKGLPIKFSPIAAELVTPTGAGIVKTLARSFDAPLQMAVDTIGYGAGATVLAECPNMLRVLIGERAPSFATDEVTVIETNIDDMNPQFFGYLYERLFAAGALDVYTSATQMKKSRPGTLLTVIADAGRVRELAGVIMHETTSSGVRYYTANRYKLDRKIMHMKTKYGTIAVKINRGLSGEVTIAPEYDTLVDAARRKKVPLKMVYDEANFTARRLLEPGT